MLTDQSCSRAEEALPFDLSGVKPPFHGQPLTSEAPIPVAHSGVGAFSRQTCYRSGMSNDNDGCGNDYLLLIGAVAILFGITGFMIAMIISV